VHNAARTPYVVVADPAIGALSGNPRTTYSTHKAIRAAALAAHRFSDATAWLTWYHKRLWTWLVIDSRSGTTMYTVDGYGTGRDSNGKSLRQQQSRHRNSTWVSPG
jgi:hypothetical protein